MSGGKLFVVYTTSCFFVGYLVTNWWLGKSIEPEVILLLSLHVPEGEDVIT